MPLNTVVMNCNGGGGGGEQSSTDLRGRWKNVFNTWAPPSWMTENDDVESDWNGTFRCMAGRTPLLPWATSAAEAGTKRL